MTIGRDHEERSISAPDGLRLFFRDYGDPLSSGVPLLCLSGLVRNSKDFAPLAQRLCPQRRLICPDYRGRGRSDYDPDGRTYRPEIDLRDMLALAHGAGLHDFVVCGTSFGGLLAMGLAVAAPVLVKGAILNDIGPEVSGSGFERIRGYVGRDQREPDLASAIVRVKEMFPRLGLTDEAEWRRFAEATYCHDPQGRLRPDWDPKIGQGLDAPVPDLWPLFRALRGCPTLAFRGENSDILEPATFNRMLAEHPRLIQISVPGKGHTPTLDEPLARAAIDVFLDKIDHDRQP